MMYWFTADQHFNHTNIITKFVFRPFKNAEEMNETIIDKYNSRVDPFDTVFSLGDFKVSAEGQNAHELMARLNGQKVFVLGNHDKNNGTNTPVKYMVIQTFGKKVLLIHRPENAQELMANDRYDLAFVGHVHEKWKFRSGDYGDMVNVGVDQWDFYPVDAKQILKAYSKWVAYGKHD